MPKVCVSGGEAGRDSPREGDREARAAIEAERTGNWQERDRLGRGGLLLLGHRDQENKETVNCHPETANTSPAGYPQSASAPPLPQWALYVTRQLTALSLKGPHLL